VVNRGSDYDQLPALTVARERSAMYKRLLDDIFKQAIQSCSKPNFSCSFFQVYNGENN